MMESDYGKVRNWM